MVRAVERERPSTLDAIVHLGDGWRDAEALHRLSGIASTSFDSMPQNGPTIVTLRAFKMSHKEGYKWIFYVQCLLPLTSILVALVMCYICYPIG